jgi:hypothetical protein
MAAPQEYFEVLGLNAPPADRKAVKRAYSKMLKVTRPEDDPEGFMRLRDAHDYALDVLRWQAEDAADTAQQITVETVQTVEQHASAIEAKAEASLSYEDMLPLENAEPAEAESETSYSIGPTPNLDAPVTLQEFVASPPLLDDLDRLLSDAKYYNDREQWNILFRKARQLDIDDYVDFEQNLLDRILRFHGYFEDHPNHNSPEKMPQKFSPSITASLFKTMNWDKVSKMGYMRGIQIDWLERRMAIRRRGVDPVPVPPTDTSGSGNVWMWIFGAFVVLKIIQALVNS